MNFEQLHQFLCVAQLGTVSAASEQLHISQPALSRSLARLEQELGIQLFDRNGRAISLNQAGATALEYVRSILHEERLMRIALNDLAHRATALHVGTVAPAPLWRLTALAVERFPEQLLSSHSTKQEDVERGVMDQLFDLGISYKPITYPAMRCCHLMDEHLSVSIPNSHPLAKKTSLSISELDGETFLLYENIGFWRDLVDKALPHSTLIIQEDYSVFQQLTQTSSALCFVTDAAYLSREIERRTIVPLTEKEACAHFYLIVNAEASNQASALFDWVESQSKTGNS